MSGPTEVPTTNPPARAASRKRRWAGVLLAILLMAAVGYWAFGRYRPSGGPAELRPTSGSSAGAARSAVGRGDPNRVMPVTVASAVRADVPVVLDALGTVTSLRTVTVRSQVNGQLLRVHFREGQLVKAGELLAEIDPRPFRVQLAQAQGQLARDRALLENARVDLERYRTLVSQDAASEQQLATQQALVHQYEGVIQTDQAQVDSARLQLAYASITAPLAGRLGLRLVDPGNLVSTGDTNGLVTITQLEPIGVVFSLPEKDLAPVLRRYRAGESMRAQALDRDQRTVLASGRLTTLDNQIDTTTGTLKMKAQFANADGVLFPNQFVNVRLAIDTLGNAIVVPSAAIQRGSPGTYVYVVRADDTATLRKVKLGPVDGERTVVSEGVAAGERVVIDGVDNLREGARVEPITKAAAEQAASQTAAPRRRPTSNRQPAR